MQEITVKFIFGDFKVKFLNDYSFVDNLLEIPQYAVISESGFYNLYKERIFNKLPKEKVIVLKLGEKEKTLSIATKIYRQLLKFPAKRNLVLVSFGGGITQDLTGFVASTLYRGIKWIYIPTTLLAMADSSIGLKTSINFGNYKNVLGTFYPPTNVYIYPGFLKTLGQLDYYSGLGEITKFYLMQKNALKNLQNSIKKIDKLKKSRHPKLIISVLNESLRIKLSYMQGDEFDLGRRNLLNYGHEFGHALESSSNFKVPHGIAIAIGIIFANMISLKKGYLSEKNFNFINKKMLFPMINSGIIELRTEYFDPKQILKNLRKDKKRTSQNLPLVLMDKNFELIKINDFTEEEFRQRVPDFLALLSPFIKDI